MYVQEKNTFCQNATTQLSRYTAQSQCNKYSRVQNPNGKHQTRLRNHLVLLNSLHQMIINDLLVHIIQEELFGGAVVCVFAEVEGSVGAGGVEEGAEEEFCCDLGGSNSARRPLQE